MNAATIAWRHHMAFHFLPRLGSILFVGIASVAAPCLEKRGLAQGANCFLAPASLVAWWPLNGDATDIRGSNVTTLHGNPSFTAGVVDQALRFDGVDDYVRVPASPGIDLAKASSFTIEFWLNRSFGGFAPILGWSDGAARAGVKLTISSGNNFCAFMYDTNGAYYGLCASPFATEPLRMNEFYHLAVRHKAGFGTTLWQNGRLVASASPASSVPLQTGYDLYLGSLFSGVLDEVSFYTTALTDEEIMGIYEAGAHGKCLSCVSPPVVVAPRQARLSQTVVP